MPALASFHHIKLPVSDVRASSDWYQRVLGLDIEIEFKEDGDLLGVALMDRTGTARIGLRLDPVRAAALAGFDLVALGVPSRDEVRAWARHLDDVEQKHGGIVTGHGGGSVLIGLQDPDGIEIRFYAA